MASGPLGIHPALRPWYGAGLRHVYFDDEALACLAEGREKSSEQDRPVTQTAPIHGHAEGGPRYADRMPPQGRVEQVVRQATRQMAPHGVKHGGSYCRPPRQPEDIATAAQNIPTVSSQVCATQTRQGSQATNTPPDQWPQTWQDRLTSTRASAKGAPVLWTYWALGEDLSGAPNAPRRDILRRILGELNLPRGTHCFWPIAMPTGESANTSPEPVGSGSESSQTAMALEANAPIFLAGLNILAPRVCVVMGSKALKTILPNSKTGPFQQAQYGRMLFLVLPDMDMLLADRERIPTVIAYLRTALQPFMGRR